jgi:hypothetical protein
VQPPCRREFLASKARRQFSFCPTTSAPPRRSSRHICGGGTIGLDNRRRGYTKLRRPPNALRQGRMNTDEMLASELDETWSDDEVQGAGKPASKVSFHFAFTFNVVHGHINVQLQVEAFCFYGLLVFCMSRVLLNYVESVRGE